MIIQRKKTREIKVGTLKIGDSNPISVQSMLKNKLTGNDAAKNEIMELMINVYKANKVQRPKLARKLKPVQSENILLIGNPFRSDS